MSNRLVIIIAAVLSLQMLFSGCATQSSSDKPLTPTYNASVYIGGNNHFLFAIDPVTGKKNWQFSTGNPIYASPLIYNERVYVGSNGTTTGYVDSLYKLNAQTGALIRTFYDNSTTLHIIATPVVDANIIYLGGTNGILYALDTGNFSIIWQYATGGAIRSSPVVFNGYVYFASDDGNVYGIDKLLGSGGAHNWQWHPGTGTTFWTSSAAIGYGANSGTNDTVLCIGGNNGNDNMYCIKLRFSPELVQQDSLWWAYPTIGPINSSPTIYGGAVVFGCDDDTVYCVDVYAGIARWTFPTNNIVESSPYAYNNIIYVGSYDGNLYAIKFINGALKWKFPTFGDVKSSPIVYQGSVLVASYDKSIYAIDTALGEKQWSFVVNNTIDCSPAIDNNTGGVGINSSISGNTN